MTFVRGAGKAIASVENKQQMRLEGSDEGGTEGFGMQVIEGCDSAKDFSIKAPRCVHRSSE